MRCLPHALLALSAFAATGCGYIHFGRLPASAVPMGAGRHAEVLSDLSTENKMLRQELALARREMDTLRSGLERAGGPVAPSDLSRRLSETAAELANLRSNYARLQAERNAAAASGSPLRAPEERTANATREHAQLQSENARLRSELESARAENAGLAERLQSATARYDQAQGAVAQLNAELLAQKQARAQAEQSNAALRAQLSTVVAQASSTGASALQGAKAPPAGASATAELRLNVAETPPEPAATVAATPPAPEGRRHTVQAGDTLETIAQRYYGAADRWFAIYQANSRLLGGGQPLQAGMELTIPAP